MFIIYYIIFLFYPLLTLKPFALPWAPHESVFNLFDLVNKIRGNPTKLGMPSAFLLSQLASLLQCRVTASAAEPLWEDVVSFFAERGVPWKPWNLSGSATASPFLPLPCISLFPLTLISPDHADAIIEEVEQFEFCSLVSASAVGKPVLAYKWLFSRVVYFTKWLSFSISIFTNGSVI